MNSLGFPRPAWKEAGAAKQDRFLFAALPPIRQDRKVTLDDLYQTQAEKAFRFVADRTGLIR
jgi:hypothetical protein